MSPTSRYIPVIGLEVHAQLLTRSKMFSPEATSYGAPPNSLVSAVTIAHPGTLPTINEAAIWAAVKLGLVCDSVITLHNWFARKNYFFPDLPANYQRTQTHAICIGGMIETCRLKHIHLEEDTAKSLHDLMPGKTLLDFNRAGTPLIEIVTEPDIRSPEEASLCLTEIRRIVRYLDICDGNMEEGSLRCDVNVSLMPVGTSTYGRRVEVKNLNSIRHVQHAVTYEIQRQAALLDAGKQIEEETRSYNVQKGETVFERRKESGADYRYFAEPDLVPFILSQADIDKIENSLPPLPRALQKLFTEKYGLSDYAASILIQEKAVALCFDAVCQHTTHYQQAANWILGPVKSFLNEYKTGIEEFPLSAAQIAALTHLVSQEEISFSQASQQLFPALLESPHEEPRALAVRMGLLDKVEDTELDRLIEEVLAEEARQLAIYRAGKKGLFGFFVATIMKRSSQPLDPRQVAKRLQSRLEADQTPS